MKKNKGGYINGIFFRLEDIKEMYHAVIEAKYDFLLKHKGRKRLPANVRRYIKVMDAKIKGAEKIIEEYAKK